MVRWHLGVPKGPPLGTLFSTTFVIAGVFSESFVRSSVLEASWVLFFMDLGCWLVVSFDVFFPVFLERPSLRRMSF